MKAPIVFFLFLPVFASVFSYAQKTDMHIAKTFHIASNGGWDYLAVSPDHKKLYVSHATQVNILDAKSGDSLGIIENTNGVHGIAFVPSLNKGYTSNGRTNNLTVFDLTTNKITGQIPVGQNPDAIMYENYTKKIITCNGRSNDLSIVDPSDGKVITIPVGGRPETAVSDDEGKLYVNIEDKNNIAVVDLKTSTVIAHWQLAGGEGPTGLAIDKVSKRLFAGCDKLLIVMNAVNGRIVDKLTIGDGCDGVAFDNSTKSIYTSNGEGTMTVIKEVSSDNFKVASTVVTKRGARTIAIDEMSHTVFLPTADYEAAAEPAPGAQRERPKMVPGSFQVLVLR